MPKFRNGEHWKKVFGPVFMYLNSSLYPGDYKLLWDDANVQVIIILSVNHLNYFSAIY